MEWMLEVMGGTIAVALAINAFFLRGIYFDLNNVKIELAKISERSIAKEYRLSVVEKQLRDIQIRINEIERRK